VLIITFFHLQ